MNHEKKCGNCKHFHAKSNKHSHGHCNLHDSETYRILGCLAHGYVGDEIMDELEKK